MTAGRLLFDERELTPARPPKVAPLLFADRDGTCQDCHTRPVVPYNSRCQECAVRVAKRSALGEGR